MTFSLIDDIRNEVDDAAQLFENCLAVPHDTVLLAEEADRVIGNVIGALKAGKNPFETIPGSRDVLAGLMLLAKETNRDALNLNPKKFNLIAQFIDKKEAVRKYVVDVARKHGQSLISNLDAYMSEKDKRDVLIKKLYKLQKAYSQVKQQAMQSDKVIGM